VGPCIQIFVYHFPITFLEVLLSQNLTLTPHYEVLLVPLLIKNLQIRIYIATSLPVVLNRCETWLLTLRAEGVRE
jgi:hypothetical protein